MIDGEFPAPGTKKCNVHCSHAAQESRTKHLPLPGKRTNVRYGEIRQRKEESGSCVAGNGGVTDIPDVSRAGHNGISSDKALLR